MKSAIHQIHFILPVILCLVFEWNAAAVQPQKAAPAPVSEEVEVSLLSLYASVIDSHDKPVKGLKQEDFVLTDAGKPVEIAQFSGDPTEAASVAFLMDTSGSMRVEDKYDIAIRIVDSMLTRLQADDEASLITFGDEQVKTIVNFTSDKDQVSNQMASQKLWGPTALWDAIVFTQRLVIKSYGKKAVVLISDGFDNRSENMFKRAVDAASKIQLPVYVCEITLPDEDEQREINFDSPLKNFAEATGAMHFAVQSDDDKEIKRVADRLADEIRYQYFIGVSGSSASASPHYQLTTKNGSYRVRLRHSLTADE